MENNARTPARKNKPTPPVEFLSDGRQRRWCNGRKKDGTQCRKAPIEGGTVCSKHGGRARHIKAAAKARIESAADRMAQLLLGIAIDDTTPPAVRLAAIKDALDRAGLSPRAALDVVHELKPWQAILDGIDRDIMDGAPTVVEGEVVPPEWGEFDDGRSA